MEQKKKLMAFVHICLGKLRLSLIDFLCHEIVTTCQLQQDMSFKWKLMDKNFRYQNSGSEFYITKKDREKNCLETLKFNHVM